MNWDAIGAIGEIISALAVLVTLVYLAIQIRQNTAAVRASATREIHDSLLTAHTPIVSSTEVARVIRLGSFEPDKLSPDEHLQFDTAIYNMFASFEIYHSQYQSGLIDNNIFGRVKLSIQNQSSTPGVQLWWSKYKLDFSNAFVELVEEQISKGKEQTREYSKFFESMGENGGNGT